MIHNFRRGVKLNKSQIIEVLTEFKATNKTTCDLNQLILNMMFYIGDTNPYLRDELIYESFSKLIMSDLLNDNQLKYVFSNMCSDEFLFYKIGEIDKDSVFKRSFSALVLALLLAAHKNKTCLDANELELAYLSAIRYLREEKDERGFILKKGWAHATAHGADVLKYLIVIDEITMDQKIHVLEAIIDKIKSLKHPFGANEDDRLARVYIAAIQHGVESDIVNKSLTKFINQINHLEHVQKENIKSFLNALNERLYLLNREHQSITYIKNMLKLLDKEHL